MSDNMENREDLEREDTLESPETIEETTEAPVTETKTESEEYSLNDDRRVKVLSPGTLVAKRFFRNRIAVTGLVILAFMFLFSFIGGLVSPYKEDQKFYRYDIQQKTYAGVIENTEFRYASADGQEFGSILQAQLVLAVQTNKDSFTYKDVTYTVTEEGPDFYSVSIRGGANIGIAYKDVASSSNEGEKLPYALQFAALKAYTNGETAFTAGGQDYTITEDGGVLQGETEVAYISRYVVNAVMGDVFLTRDFKDQLITCIESGAEDFYFTGEHSRSEEEGIKMSVLRVGSDGTQEDLGLMVNVSLRDLRQNGELQWLFTMSSNPGTLTVYDLQGTQIAQVDPPAGVESYYPISMLDDGRILLIIGYDLDHDYMPRYATIDADAFLSGSTEYTEMEFVG